MGDVNYREIAQTIKDDGHLKKLKRLADDLKREKVRLSLIHHGTHSVSQFRMNFDGWHSTQRRRFRCAWERCACPLLEGSLCEGDYCWGFRCEWCSSRRRPTSSACSSDATAQKCKNASSCTISWSKSMVCHCGTTNLPFIVSPTLTEGRSLSWTLMPA